MNRTPGGRELEDQGPLLILKEELQHFCAILHGSQLEFGLVIKEESMKFKSKYERDDGMI